MATDNRPLSEPPQAPILFNSDPDLLLQEVETAITKHREAQDKLVIDVQPNDACFENTIVPLLHQENVLLNVAMPAKFLKDVSTNQDLRDASRKAERILNDSYVESDMRQDVFKLVDAVVARGERLDTESQYVVEKLYRGFVKRGVAVSDASRRDRFKHVQKQIAELSTACKKNFTSERGGLWLTPQDLDGLSQDTVKNLKRGEGENQDKVWLTNKPNDYKVAMKFVKNAEIRKRILVAFENKCNDNVPLLREIFILRDEAARLLGYTNNAASKIEDRMARSPRLVEDFLQDVRHRLTPAAQAVIQKELSIKSVELKSHGLEATDDKKLYLWDTEYYGRLMKEQRFSLDQKKISEYFPLEQTLRGMLANFELLLGLRVVDITTKVAELSTEGRHGLWHEDVRAFQLWDDKAEGGSFLGYLYLDLHPRDFKWSHPTHIGLQKGYTRTDGSRHYPSSILLCTFTTPLPNKPSLLRHEECVSLFHELGHAFHSLVSRTRFARFHGTNTVRDFVEAPSKMLENWCWNPAQLKSMSIHWAHLSSENMLAWKKGMRKDGHGEVDIPEPPRQMPDEMIASMVNCRHLDTPLFDLRQVFLAMFDMRIHSPTSHQEVKEMDFQRLYNKMRHDIVGTHGPDEEYTWGNVHAKFSHMWGSYDAGYYGYVWASSIAADLFSSAFSADPMSKAEGRRYRYTILERGGSRPEMELLEEFLGRKPNNEAWMKQIRLV